MKQAVILSEKEQKFISWCKERIRTVDEVARFLDCSARNAVQFIDKLRRYGYPIESDPKIEKFFWRSGAEGRESKSLPPLTRETYRILAISDVKIGHNNQQLTLLHTLYKLVDERYKDEKLGLDFGVDIVICLGNLLAGPEDRGADDRFLRTFDEQVDYAIRYFPKLSKVKTYCIAGPGELSLSRSSGRKKGAEERHALQKICLNRPDMVYAGDLNHFFPITQTEAVVYAAHSSKKRTVSLYTKSLPLQYVSDSFNDLSVRRRGGKVPDVIILGGHHSSMYFPPLSACKSKNAIMVPSFCDPISSHMDREKQGATPTIGFTVVDLHFSKEDGKKFIRAIPRNHFWTGHQIENDCSNVPLNGNGNGNGVDSKNNGVSGQPQNEQAENPSAQKPESDKAAGNNNDDVCQQIVNWLYHEPLTAGEISRRLQNYSKDRIKKELIPILSKKHDVRWSDAKKHYYLPVSKKQIFAPVPEIKKFLSEVYTVSTRILIYSDTHCGSLSEQPHLISRVGKVAKENNVDAIFHCGDVLDGEGLFGRKHMREIYLTSAKGQREWAEKILPSLSGITTYAISGSHDQIFKEQSGEESVQLISQKRKDIKFVGEDVGVVTDKNGMCFKLFHPSGGVPKGLSYRPQEFVRHIAQGFAEDIHALFIGHLHMAFFIFHRGVACFLVPCLQSQTSYLRKKCYYPMLGVWVVTLTIDNYKDVSRVVLDYRPFDPIEYEAKHYLRPVKHRNAENVEKKKEAEENEKNESKKKLEKDKK